MATARSTRASPSFTQTEVRQRRARQALHSTGSSLFSSTSRRQPGFANSITVPRVRRSHSIGASSGRDQDALLKLRDDPTTVNTAQPMSASDASQQSDAAPSRQQPEYNQSLVATTVRRRYPAKPRAPVIA